MELGVIDQQFLDKYVANFKFISEATSVFIGGISSLEHKILCKSRFSEAIGFSDQELAESQLEPEIIKFKNKVIESRKTLKVLCTRSYVDGKPRFYVLSCAPIINPVTNNIVAIFGDFNYIETFNFWSILVQFYLHDGIKLRQFELPNIKLTEREKQVIFLFLLNLDSNSIAEIISKLEDKSISKNAIDQVFATQLMPKFEVYGRKALYVKLVKLGYHRIIPHNVLRDGFIIEISDYVIFN